MNNKIVIFIIFIVYGQQNYRTVKIHLTSKKSASLFPISPLFRTFAGSNFPNLERTDNLLYHHPKRQGQQPERHQLADSQEQAGGHHGSVRLR